MERVLLCAVGDRLQNATESVKYSLKYEGSTYTFQLKPTADQATPKVSRRRLLLRLPSCSPCAIPHNATHHYVLTPPHTE